MNWFQQNRLLGTFLAGFGICLLLVGLVFYWTGSKWNAARTEFDTAAAERSRLEHLDPFPSDANFRKLKVHLENYGVALDKLKEELKTRVIPLPSGLAPNEFQSRLLQVMTATSQKARETKVKLPDNFHLGFNEFITSLPNTDAAPLLGQELSQIQMLINILLDARVDNVTSFQRTPLPEERGGAPGPAPTPSRGRKSAQANISGTKLLERNVVDLTFKAGPSVARKVLNQIASSPAQFYIVRTLYVRNEKDKGPPREKMAETGAAAVQSTGPNTPSNAPLNFIVGNEHVEVSARIEMLRFTF
jgi:hypothetical protein